MKDDVVFQLILYYRTIVYVTETFSKMASTLSQKWLTIFAKRLKTFIPYDLVETSQAFGPNTYQIMYGETLNF